jgi:hypothetical protein
VEVLIEECGGFPHAAHDDQVDALTQALNRLYRVSSLIYAVAESEIAIDPIKIESHWPCVYGMDVRWNGTAALWGALDPTSDIQYLCSEHYQGDAHPAVHAPGISARGKSIPGVIDVQAGGRTQRDGWRLLQQYRDLGLDLEAAENSEQSGIYEVLQRMSSGRLKVFRTLENFFHEIRLYRRDEHGQVVKQNDRLMDCLRCLCLSGRSRMRRAKIRADPDYDSAVLSGTPQSWMAL